MCLGLLVSRILIGLDLPSDALSKAILTAIENFQQSSNSSGSKQESPNASGLLKGKVTGGDL